MSIGWPVLHRITCFAQLEPTEKPCQMLIKAQFEIPKSWTKARKAAAAADIIYPGKPDIDNIAKIVSD